MDGRNILIGFLVLVLAGCLFGLGYLYLQLQELQTVDVPIPQAVIDARQRAAIEEPEPVSGTMDYVTLYYPLANHELLATETIETLPSETLTQKIEIALTELLRGPRGDSLINPIPDGTQLQSVFWREQDSRAYVSFTPALLDERSLHALGEWATIYSIVNTVAEQSPAIRDVQILIDGEPIRSDYTVWDWSLPFEPDMTFVRYDVGQ